MIVSLWLAYIAARKGTGVHIPTDSAPDGPVVEVDALATGEELLSRLFQRVLEIWAEPRAEPQGEPRAEPQAEPQAEPAAAPPASQQADGPSPQGDADRGVQAPGQVLVEDRMKVQYLRWSQTRVHRVSSLLEGDLVEDRKEQTENGVSQVLLQGMPDTVMEAVMEAVKDTVMEAVTEAVTEAVKGTGMEAMTDTVMDTGTDTGLDTETDTGTDTGMDSVMDPMMDPVMDSTLDTKSQVQLPSED
ncbi:spermatogenesis-associated protein 19, mitochondrial isoform X1 [Anser cygnoides]|uniref:spermatogenesis-associated protein 19, mitochondrial isoform X1 n=1 Tax=Anser cygnoides TaxID=8845 RepID=UPI00200980AA|nr:spermatogenesis-associated protein 19, mitochondrial isoform X1 [Anser cygnoides]XP_047919396.1 spermatogenesis-associated protein 19, mitochondrial isoform X1 [Anser cygnoides]